MKGSGIGSAKQGAGREHRRWFGWVLGALVCGVVATSAPPAHAQEKDELARRHFESGAAYFAEAEYEEALKAFRKAYELSERPQILLNIAVVEERLGNLRGAVDVLGEYQSVNPNDPDIETIRLRRDNLMERLQAQQSASGDSATEPPPPAEEQSAPPAAPAPPPAPAAPPPSPTEGPNLIPAYAALSLGGLAGVAAILTGLGAQSEYDELESTCGGSCSSEQTFTGSALALTSTILTGVAVVGVGVGVTLWATAERPQEAAQGPPTLRVALGPSGGYAEAHWRF
jgi:hypothetical protein